MKSSHIDLHGGGIAPWRRRTKTASTNGRQPWTSVGARRRTTWRSLQNGFNSRDIGLPFESSAP